MNEKKFLIESEGIIFKCTISEVYDINEEEVTENTKIYLTNYRIIFIHDGDTEMESLLLNKITKLGFLMEDDLPEDYGYEDDIGMGEYGVSYETDMDSRKIWFYSEKAQIEFYQELTRLVLEM